MHAHLCTLCTQILTHTSIKYELIVDTVHTSCNFCAVVTTSLEEDTYIINENNGSVAVCIRLEGDLERSVMVNLTTLSDTAQG